MILVWSLSTEAAVSTDRFTRKARRRWPRGKTRRTAPGCLGTTATARRRPKKKRQAVEYAAAIDVAKGSGMVCTRVPGSRADRRRQKVWQEGATSGEVTAPMDHLRCEGIQRLVLESTSDARQVQGPDHGRGGAQEMSHVEMLTTMVAWLLEGAPATATTKAAAADPVVGARLGGMDPQQAIVAGGGPLLAYDGVLGKTVLARLGHRARAWPCKIKDALT